MPRLQITVLDLVSKGGRRNLFGRVMNPNLASIMPQVVAAWCEELGHHVRYICYTGAEDLVRELQHDTDVLIIGAFTRAAQAAYAISNLARQRGAITVLGGPHARCYPEDAAEYFDYVLGLTDKNTIADILHDGAPHRPIGRQISALRQPLELPSLAQRWRFVEETIAKAPAFKVVPMIGSMGCPYTCSFCIDSVVDYQPLAFEQIRADLRFLLGKLKRPCVGWHDPNFGVRFDDYMTAIEDVVPPGRMRFVAESSLSLLSEPHLRRLQKNGFVALLPGIESWFELGNKSKTGRNVGVEKVRQVADHVNTILRYVPYAMNVRPKNYGWDEFYERAVDVTRYAMSWPRAYRRLQANRGLVTKSLSLVRSGSSKRAEFQAKVRDLLTTDPGVRRFFDGESRVLPSFYRDKLRNSLGALWEALPSRALMHDQNAYLKSSISARALKRPASANLQRFAATA